MAMDPGAIMKLMAAKNKFDRNHPKFAAFLQMLLRQGVWEGDVLEITISRPDGTTNTANMRVTAEDMELFEELKNLGSR